MLVAKAPTVLSEGMVYAAEETDPRIPQVLELLQRVWPEGYDEVWKTVTGWYPVIWPGEMGRGHFSGCAQQDGWVYSSLNDVIGGAEGLLHEMGHLKLKRMGVYYEHWNAVLANRPDELYVSPIRKDKLRPMGAVLHGLYSYLHVTEFDRRGVLVGAVDEETWRLNVARIVEGTAEVERHARWLDKEFGESVIRWGHDLSV